MSIGFKSILLIVVICSVGCQYEADKPAEPPPKTEPPTNSDSDDSTNTKAVELPSSPNAKVIQGILKRIKRLKSELNTMPNEANAREDFIAGFDIEAEQISEAIFADPTMKLNGPLLLLLGDVVKLKQELETGNNKDFEATQVKYDACLADLQRRIIEELR